MELACPACGFLTICEGFYGTFSICDVCGWEDDGVQLANPACGGGANRESLIEAQANALREHPLEEAETLGIRRAANWRPLNPEEIAVAEADRKEKNWKNKAVYHEAEAYWCKTP